jgi:hypothetical protein
MQGIIPAREQYPEPARTNPQNIPERELERLDRIRLENRCNGKLPMCGISCLGKGHRQTVGVGP